MKQTLLLIAISILLFVSSQAQKKIKGGEKPAISNIKRTEKLNKKQPSVYARFENYSKYTWDKTQETYNVAWFRLHNNFNGNISFCQYDTSVSATGKGGVHYEVEKSPNQQDSASRDNKSIPRGFPAFDFCNEYVLKPKATFLFGITENHLIEDTRIKIRIFYPWEDSVDIFTGKEPAHYIYIYTDNLPKRK